MPTVREPSKTDKDSKYWLTVVRVKTACARVDCHGQRILKLGDAMVYRKEPKECLCVQCATAEGIKYRPSKAWELSHRKRVKRGATWMREKSA